MRQAFHPNVLAFADDIATVGPDAIGGGAMELGKFLDHLLGDGRPQMEPLAVDILGELMAVWDSETALGKR